MVIGAAGPNFSRDLALPSVYPSHSQKGDFHAEIEGPRPARPAKRVIPASATAAAQLNGALFWPPRYWPPLPAWLARTAVAATCFHSQVGGHWWRGTGVGKL